MKTKYMAPLTEVVRIKGGEVMQGFDIGVSGEAPPEDAEAKQFGDADNGVWDSSTSNHQNLWDD